MNSIKLQDTKIDIQKSDMFLHTNNTLSERKENNPVYSRINKNRIHLTKEGRDLCLGN